MSNSYYWCSHEPLVILGARLSDAIFVCLLAVSVMTAAKEWALDAINKLRAQYLMLVEKGTLQPGVCWFFKASVEVLAANPKAISLPKALGLKGGQVDYFWNALTRYPKKEMERYFGLDAHFRKHKSTIAVIFAVQKQCRE